MSRKSAIAFISARFDYSHLSSLNTISYKQILLTKIIYLLYIGEPFLQQEATTLFFSVTKLFQHKDPALRQMVYLVIKELSGVAEDVIMVTSSIMKDMQPNLEVIYRPNAVRTLCRIIDVSVVSFISSTTLAMWRESDADK